MGKKRIAQLLEQLQDNQQKELQNAAAIYTVAHIAVDQLQAQTNQAEATLPALPPVPTKIDEAELKQRYGSHHACRKAAKERGIKFSRTPSWERLAIAFSYLDACQTVVHNYLETHAEEDLSGISIELKLQS